jgi:CRP-like cAMP-binding protein
MIKALQSVPLFGAFTPELLEEISDFAETRTCRQDEVIFREGDEGKALFVIQTGQVEIRKHDKLLAVFGDGEVFGEMVLFDEAVRSADAIAKRASTLHVVDNEKFRECLMRHPDQSVQFLYASIQELSRRLRATSQHLVTVFETGRMVGQNMSVEKMCEGIIRCLMHDVAGATGGAVLTANQFGGEFEEACRITMFSHDTAELARLAGAATGETILRQHDTGAFLGAPLSDGESVLGWVFVEKAGAGARFTMEEEVIIRTVGNQVGLGVSNTHNRQEEEARKRLEWNRMKGGRSL